MSEKIKDKDAEAAQSQDKDALDKDPLDKGLEDTFPASDPISPIQPPSDKEKGGRG